MIIDPFPGRELLKITQIQEFLGLGKSEFYEMLKNDPTFPKPRLIGKGKRYRKMEVFLWIESLPKDEPEKK